MPKFTHRYLLSLEPQDKAYLVNEMDGFAIRVYPSGKKSFVYVYKEHGKTKRPTIGQFPAMPLTEARKRYQEMHSRRKQGLPPIEVSGTLEAVASDYIKKYAKKKKKSWEEDQRILKKDIFPVLGKKKVKEIRRGDVSALLHKYADKPFKARNAFKVLRQVYNWAIETDLYGLEYSPCDRLSQPVADVKKERFLSAEEIERFWYGMEQTNISRTVICALRLILVTGQRPSECCELELKEIDGDWWNLPSHRAKNGKPHRIYLTDLAKEIIQPEHKRKHAFPSPDTKEPFPHTRLSQSLLRFRNAKDNDGEPLHWPFESFTPHDLRRTCATYLAEIETPKEVIKAVLNHQTGDVTDIYNRYKYDKQKKAALLAWERRLREILAA